MIKVLVLFQRILVPGLAVLTLLLLSAAPAAAAEPDNTASVTNLLAERSYNPIGKRDPFQPLVSKAQKVSDKPEKERGPLEKFELGQFRLMAMLLVKNSPRAMVKAPDGKSYIVKPGDKIGRLDGEIVAIETKVLDPATRTIVSPDRLKIKEIGFDPYTNKKIVEFRYITM